MTVYHKFFLFRLSIILKLIELFYFIYNLYVAMGKFFHEVKDKAANPPWKVVNDEAFV